MPDDEGDDEEEEVPTINVISCIILLIIVTVLVALYVRSRPLSPIDLHVSHSTAEFLVDSIKCVQRPFRKLS